uniref:Uncharacterized protein n=1 Tax=Siphoviridae sp. ctLsx2 TaxID=2826254 RepID=A0A8S5QSW4_9CAUD|nr:MAG TPA: hypothetical protein [Siphoviridae sp. ctLsx2]
MLERDQRIKFVCNSLKAKHNVVDLAFHDDAVFCQPINVNLVVLAHSTPLSFRLNIISAQSSSESWLIFSSAILRSVSMSHCDNASVFIVPQTLAFVQELISFPFLNLTYYFLGVQLCWYTYSYAQAVCCPQTCNKLKNISGGSVYMWAFVK